MHIRLPCGLIVSCQARADNPLHGPAFMAAMALAAQQGGAIGVRVNGPDDIYAVKKAVNLPVIGLWKLETPGSEVVITPTFESARALAEAGADILAVDATSRTRPEEPLENFMNKLKSKLGLPVFADVATLEEGIAAAQAGADYVATTLSGYTSYTQKTQGPDLELVVSLAQAVAVPVVAEGRFWTPEQVAQAFALGAHGVVVGTAITNPREITRRFAGAVPEGAQ